jgi:plastocyanin
MSDTTTVEGSDTEQPAPDETEQLEPLVESPVLGAHAGLPDPVKTRFLLPLLVPLLSMAAVGLLTVNISRVFLAGDKDSALVLGIIITLSILFGATALAAMPRLRTSTLVMIVASVVVVVSAAGLVALGPSMKEEGGGGASAYVNVPGKPGSTVSVSAGPQTSFNGVRFTGNYQAKAGIVKIDYGGDSGHTLAIGDSKYSDFLLTSGGSGKHSEQVKFAPGSYTIFCTVPGHEAAGMKATITVK